jgi:large subunit ribosomal protein L13e
MVKHNLPIVTSHFKKNWCERVRTNFNQPAKAKARKLARVKKAARIFPRPTKGSLKPLIRISNVHQNHRTRLGRGFSVAELKAAKLGIQWARSVGISVDTRRRNTSQEGLERNVARLMEYKSKVVLFPKRNLTSDKGVKKGVNQGGLDDATKEQRQNVVQLKGQVLPAKKEVHAVELREITPADTKKKAWKLLRSAKKEARAYANRVQKKLNPVIEVGKKEEKGGEQKEDKKKKK